MRSTLARRWSLLVLLAILVLALGLRFYRLDAQSFWNDEGTSVALAQRNLATIARNAAADIHPPLYYYLLHYWVLVAGTGELGVRALSALAGVALVAGVYFLGRRLFSPPAGLIGAGLAAIAPFQVYYAQEARMYIFVSLFGLLSMLAYERLLVTGFGAGPGKVGWMLWAAYAVASALALYSHYIAFTLLAAQNLGFFLWLVAHLRTPEKSRLGWAIAGWGVMQLVLIATYIPWLLLSLDSLRSWPAVGAPLTALRYLLTVAQTMGLGITVGGGAGSRLVGVALGLVVLLGIVGQGECAARNDTSARPRYGALFAVLYLLMPILLMFLLSLRRPMYKDKFLLLATPAYYLLQARGILSVGRWGRRLLRARWLGAVLAMALFVAVGCASTYALWGLYFNPKYYRDDYRDIVQYINATSGPEDCILIDAPAQIETVNLYYHGPLAEYPLPLERPLDPASTQAALEGIYAKHTRIYAIFWATGDSDPQRLIEGWLDGHCFKALDSWFGNVRLVVYAVPRTAAHEVAEAVDYTLGDMIRLRGYTLLTPEPQSGDILQLTLFWEALKPIPERYKVFTHLVDGAGNIVAQHDSEPGGGAALTSDWQVGQVITDNYGVLIAPGTPPGKHTLRLGMYGLNDGTRLKVAEAGQVVGDAIDLAQITLRPAQSPPPIAALGMQQADQGRWGALRLVGHDLARLGFEHEALGTLRPGEAARLVLYWRKEEGEVPGTEFTLALVSPAGKVAWSRNLTITGGRFPMSAWRLGEVVRDIQLVPLPQELPAGTYRLTLRPSQGDNAPPYTLGRLTIVP